MRREEVPSHVSTLAFDFFFWFSRFEFALKENEFLKTQTVGANADPGWKEFADKFSAVYAASASAKRLLELSPNQQTVGPGNSLKWKPITFPRGTTQLHQVVRLLKTVRNNLFHGGKHGGGGWDSPQRTEELLKVGITVLDELAVLGGFDADYRRYY
jgi:hypothetical protein